MRFFTTVFALFSCLIIIGQPVSLVLNPETQEPIKWPEGFYGGGNQLLVGFRAQEFNNYQGILRIGNLGDVHVYPNPVPFSYALYSTNHMPDGILSLSNFFVEKETELYFSILGESPSDRGVLLKSNIGNESLQVLNSDEKVRFGLNIYDSILVSEYYQSYNSNYADTALLTFSDVSGIGAIKNDSALFRNGFIAHFKGQLLLANRGENGAGRKHDGVLLLNPQSPTEVKQLMPKEILDTLESGNGKTVYLQPYASDSVLFFIQLYTSADFCQYTLFASKGEEGDAVECAVIFKKGFYDNAGLDWRLEDNSFPQNYIWHNGYLYFYRHKEGFHFELARCNGKPEQTERVGNYLLYPEYGTRNSLMTKVDNHLYLLQKNPEISGRLSNNLVRLDLNTMQDSVVWENSNLFNEFQIFSDSLALIFSGSGSAPDDGFSYTLLNLNEGSWEPFYQANKTFENGVDGAVVLGDNLYFTGEEDGEEVLLRYRLGGTNSIHENQLAGFAVFPNPATETLKVTSNTGNPVVLSIFNISGQKLHQEIFTSEISIAIPNWKPGLYLVKCENTTTGQAFNAKIQIL
ncbi:MAG: T9SS type A sorting domain-containing protein [Luteibaculum sp.]